MQDPRFATFAARQKHFIEVWDEVERQVARKTNADWLALLSADDIPFSLVNKLLAFNLGEPLEQRVEVVILSRNDPVSGMRVFRSAQHYGLPIQRGVFTRGESPWRYLKPLNAHLFLSTNEADVRSALRAGVPAARVYPHSARASSAHPNQVRIAFDGDAVIFSDEAEQVYQTGGLDAFQAHEHAHSATPLAAGPFKPLLLALQRLQHEPANGMRIRTALVTARSAPAHERAIRTLMEWNVEIDEAMFLGVVERELPFGDLRHAPHEEDRREHEADRHGDDHVEEDREEETREQDEDVAAWRHFEQPEEVAKLRHVPGDEQEECCE